MGLQAKPAIGKVNGVHLCSDFEPFAVIRLPHKAEQPCHIQQRPAFNWPAFEFGKAVTGKTAQPVISGIAFVLNIIKRGKHHGITQTGIPCFNMVGKPAFPGGLSRIIGMGGQPFSGKGDIGITI